MQNGFQGLGLSEIILTNLVRLGYEVPTPIQTATIPPLLLGKDFLGQAQTGTGKTAAFALPLLMKLDLNRKAPQILVLTPTRELAIQVAEAFQRYANGLDDFRVAPIYGGQDISAQIKKLKRGLHVVVGTTGRVMDHLRRGTLKLDHLACLVLDEADEMLRMGFIEDIEWILEQIPEASQIALFSATLPPPIRRIANKHLTNPVEVTIEQTKATSPIIRQRYWMVAGPQKLNAMIRILELEKYDAILVFVRTKIMTEELATRLESQGFAAAALSGDMSQAKREQTVARFKSGKLNILVATDVAARGLDIDRISHVINYDIPHNVESYIHRIGRTGRAGRSGEAILFVAPRENGLLFGLKKAMGGKMEMMTLPTARMVHDVRVDRFKQTITETLGLSNVQASEPDGGAPDTVAVPARAGEGLNVYRELLGAYCQEQNVPALDVAAALAVMMHAGNPLVEPREPERETPAKNRTVHVATHGRHEAGRDMPKRAHHEVDRDPRKREAREGDRDRPKRAHHEGDRDSRKREAREGDRDRPKRVHHEVDRDMPKRAHHEVDRDPRKREPSEGDRDLSKKPDSFHERKSRTTTSEGSTVFASRKSREEFRKKTERYRIDVGRRDGVQPGELVTLISDGAGLDRRNVGQIDITEDATYIELPAGMPSKICRELKNLQIAGKTSNFALANQRIERRPEHKKKR